MMRSRPWMRLATALALLGAACGDDPAQPPEAPEGFPFASASPECGPADGPAVFIRLLRDTLPPPPPGEANVQVFLWHGLSRLAGESWTVGGDSPDGFAVYEDSLGATTPLSGTVTVTGVGADSTVEGQVDLVADGTVRVRGGFRARWIPRTLLCG